MNTRRQIIDHIAGRLQQIAPGKIWTLPDGPYACSSNIVAAGPWRQAPYTDNQLPAICWRDKTEQMQGMFGPDRWRLTLHLGGYLAGTAPAIAARDLLADMAAAIGADPRCGGLAQMTIPGANRLLQRTEGITVAAAMMELQIIYTPVNVAAETFRLLDELDNLLTDETGSYLTW